MSRTPLMLIDTPTQEKKRSKKQMHAPVGQRPIVSPVMSLHMIDNIRRTMAPIDIRQHALRMAREELKSVAVNERVP